MLQSIPNEPTNSFRRQKPRSETQPIKVVIFQDCDLDSAGLRELFGHFPKWLRVVRDPNEAEVVLFDWRLAGEERTATLIELLELGLPKIVVLTWDFTPGSILQARLAGIAGYLSKGMAGMEMVDAIVRIHRGERLITKATQMVEQLPLRPSQYGLTWRELQVLKGIACGRSNDEISAELFLSINTIKSYIRSIYRKIGVVRRTEAVIWAHEHELTASYRLATKAG